MGAPNLGLSSDEILLNDQKAKKLGLMIGVPGQLYFMSISRISVVYIDFIKGDWNRWLAWRETHYIGEYESSSVKVIANGSSFEYVLEKTKKYLSYVKRNK